MDGMVEVGCPHLRGSSRLEAFEDDVSDPLAGEHVAPHHCSLRGGAEQAVGGDPDRQRGQAALVQGDVLGHHAPHGIDDGRVRHRRGGVSVAEHLRAGPCNSPLTCPVSCAAPGRTCRSYDRYVRLL